MLIETQASPSGQPSQPMVSSPGPGKYDIFERLKRRFNLYRNHQQVTYQKNLNFMEAQTHKSAQETARLQQQFLNNNHNTKSKQQKSSNSGGTSVRGNKRQNNASNSSDGGDAKSNKLPKLAAAVSSSASNKASSSYRNNNFNHSPSTQVDIKPKPVMTNSLSNSSANNHLSPTNQQTEIKREVIDNSYFESVNVDVLRDFLATTNSSNSNNTTGFEGFNSDVWKDILNDGGLGDDGLAGANFGDEDFIAKFLEEINSSNEFGQQTIPNNTNINNNIKPQQLQLQQQQQQVVTNFNPSLGTPVTSPSFNRNNQYINSSNELPVITSTTYHPIQPRIGNNNIISSPNIVQRPNNTISNASLSQQTNAIPNNIISNPNMTTQRNNIGPNVMQHQGLLVTQQPVIQGQQNPQQIYQQQQTQLTQQTILTQPTQIQLRLPNNTLANLTNQLNGQQNMSIQLSIQVPQQQQTQQAQQQQQQQQQVQQLQQQPSAQPTQPPAASIALKQMAQQAQQAQQKTHQWVMSNSIPPQAVIQQQSSSIQSVQTPQIQIQQQHSQIQQPNQQKMQTQYFNSQQQQLTYWQPIQSQQQQQPQMQQQHQQQIMQQPQQQITLIAQQQNQSQQNQFQTYWQQPQQQIVNMPQQQPQQQQQQQQTQQQQHYYSNYNNYY